MPRLYKNLPIIFMCLIYEFAYSLPLYFEGISKLSLNDINSITEIDINRNNLNDDEISIIVKDLYNSNLIFDLELKKYQDKFLIKIIENNLIENIYLMEMLLIMKT